MSDWYDYITAADGVYVGVEEADAAIAELEAEVQHQVERREEEKLRAVNAEVERDALRDVYRGLVGKDWNWETQPREGGDG